MREDSVVVLGTGNAANLARFRCLGIRDLLLEKHGLPRESTHPVRARLTFRDGLLGDVRIVADITARTAG